MVPSSRPRRSRRRLLEPHLGRRGRAGRRRGDLGDGLRHGRGHAAVGHAVAPMPLSARQAARPAPSSQLPAAAPSNTSSLPVWPAERQLRRLAAGRDYENHSLCQKCWTGGDVVCCYADIQKVGTTSITIGVEAWVLRPQEMKDHFKVTEGVFTFVALDETGKKCRVPPE